jgi:CheY-like chemotaxis protein
MIIDIGLPDMTGLEVARLIRGFGFRDCLLIALSGYGHDRARRDSEQAGCNFHLAKPASPERLLALLGVAVPPASVH